MSYLNQVCNLIENNKDRWDYYDCHHHKTMEDIFNNPKDFIHQTFLFAGKNKLIPVEHDHVNDLKITEARAAHSISSFFLGIILAEGLLDNLGDFIKSDKYSNETYPFSYIWILTCLYHDYGYQLEKDKDLCQRLSINIHKAQKQNQVRDLMRTLPFYYGINCLRKIKNIRESIWKNSSHAEYRCKGNINSSESCNECQILKEIECFYAHVHKVVYVDNINVTIPMRTSNDISRYFVYRLLYGNNGVGCIDHGIAGGMLFFDRIIKNYAKAYLKAKRYNGYADISYFRNPNDFNYYLRFSFNQLKIFAYIADCIINHNVWKADINNKNIYYEFYLDNLIQDKFEKVNFYKNPLLFILVMSDTLEPYKNLNESSIDIIEYNYSEPIQNFERFNIEVGYGVIKIRVQDNFKHHFWKKLIDMQDWIDIQCEQSNNGFNIILNKPLTLDIS